MDPVMRGWTETALNECPGNHGVRRVAQAPAVWKTAEG